MAWAAHPMVPKLGVQYERLGDVGERPKRQDADLPGVGPNCVPDELGCAALLGLAL